MIQCSEKGGFGFLCHREAQIPPGISGFPFLVAYMPHFCFALPFWMFCKILSNCPQLSFIIAIPIQQVNSHPASHTLFSEKQRASWPSSSASHIYALENPVPLSLLASGLPSLSEALISNFWPPLSPSS